MSRAQDGNRKIPLEHCTSGFCSTPQAGEALERGCANMGREDRFQHTFFQN